MNLLLLLKKIAYAVAEMPFSLCRVKNPVVCMTLLVKNEEDILEQNLISISRKGSIFIVTDNNSTDRTPEILRKYREKGG